MSDSDGKPDSALTGLNPEQQSLLSAALKQIENAIVERASKRIRNWIIGVAVAFTGFGVFTITGVKSTIIEQSAKGLVADSELRRDVLDRIAEERESATKLIEEYKRIAQDMDKEAARAAVGISSRLQDIHAMMDQIRKDAELMGAERREPQE